MDEIGDVKSMYRDRLMRLRKKMEYMYFKKYLENDWFFDGIKLLCLR